MWTANPEPLDHGTRYTLARDGRRLAYREVLHLLATDDRFAAWYSDLLAASPLPAYFWEHPAATTATVEHDYQFVLLSAPTLARARPDPAAFSEQFRANAKVAVFQNLGGDATLIAPTPGPDPDAGTHLAAFLRRAPAGQVREFWRRVAVTMQECLGDAPRWLSTSGLGVFWLHVRIDSQPKYYQHRPYRSW